MKIDLDKLVEAFEWNSDSQQHYFDKETGAVLMVTDDDRRVFERIEELRANTDSDPKLSFEDALKEIDEPDWMIDSIVTVRPLLEDESGRYIVIPSLESRDGWRDMEAFIETVEDERARDLLTVAISGPGSFRRFKDVLPRWPEERERWFKFQHARNLERVREWLECEEIEVGE